MSEGDIEEHIEEIAGLEQKLGKHYIYYVPNQSKTAPYKFMIPYTDEEANIIYFCHLLVEESETGYSAVIEKYGRYCHCIAYNILYDELDSEECVNDTYFITWNRIPPKAPDKLSVFLGKITRNLAIDRFRYYNRDKRGKGQTVLVLEELDECIPSNSNTEAAVGMKILTDTLNTFLRGLPAEKRKIFVRRYWYLSPIAEIAEDFGISESKAKVTLFRTREKLKQFLEREGITV